MFVNNYFIQDVSWLFLKTTTFLRLNSMYFIAPKRSAPKRPCAPTVGAKTAVRPNGRRQNGRAPQRSAPKRPCAPTVGAKTPAPNRSRQTGCAKTSCFESRPMSDVLPASHFVLKYDPYWINICK